MPEQSVVAVYPTMAKAEAAVEALSAGGFPIDKVSIIAQNLQSEKVVHGFVTAKDTSKAGAQAGAWLGGIFGLLAGAAFVWVPGIGPLIVAGPLAAALLGGLEGALGGAALGGVLGGIAGIGISQEHILKYEERVRGGKYLLVAHGEPADVAKAHGILKDTGADEMAVHTQVA
ncbi:MAG: permease [Gemmataceae bacterium]|nr:permease [Gemmataceae bacterium]